MISLVLSSCLVLAWADPPSQEPGGPLSSPADVVAALETAISDAIARAEPSVVAIHRFKGEQLPRDSGRPRSKTSIESARATAAIPVRRGHRPGSPTRQPDLV